MADGYLENGLTPEELAALPPYEKVANLTFVEVEALYGEETAICVGIAKDPDTWVPTDEEFAQMRPAIEVEPEWVEAHRAGRIKMPPRPPVTKVQQEVVLDSDIVEFFEHLDPHWQKGRLNDFLRIVIFKRHPDSTP
ncbi:MAG: BrnA antitoxin family protein [Chloroflexota bacterium]|nr:BrnA antitoxin family protein [Chloroflexota bacterium]MDE2961242.1 BrnA antitoxin family protein [Chloroflexota bacterium]